MGIHRSTRRAVLAAAAAATALAARARAATTPVAVIGATAQSAPEILRQALAQGRRVTAVARRPEAVTISHANLTIMGGDVRDPDSLEAALTGDEVVISLVGPRVDPRVEIQAMDLFSLGTANIIAAMKKKGNKRLLPCSSIGIRNNPTEKPAGDDPRTMWVWNSRKLYADMRAMERIVRASGLEFVILRPGFLIDGPQTNSIELAVEDAMPPTAGPIVSFADFAAFVLSLVDGDQYLGKAVATFSNVSTDWGKNLDYDKMWELRKSQGPIDVY
ncbi:MAG: NAD(P)H-binding protein [Rhodospirillaceae bacterium]|nr:NAD(P)H-binding protein [Rhodospirillaceae bacterium]